MYSSNKTTYSRLDTSGLKAKLTKQYDTNTHPNSDQFQALSRMYQTQSLSKLLKSGQKKPSVQRTIGTSYFNGTPRTNTPKSSRTNQDYFFFTKATREQNKIHLSQLISKTQQSNSKSSNSLIKDSSLTNKPSTDRKYNLLSLDADKLMQKIKTERMEQQENKQEQKKTEAKQTNQTHFSLDDFVTQVSLPNSSKINTISPFKQTKSLSPNNRVLSMQRKFTYYVSQMYESMKTGTDPQSQLFRDHALQTFNCIGFCMNQKNPDHQELEKKRIDLPPRSTKFRKTVVFDLDETLIHCNENQNQKADIYLPITFPSGDTVQAGINVRPWAKQILQQLSELCEVIVFTASHQCYASRVIQYLDNTKCLAAQLFRDRCIVSDDGVHMKDLRIFNRDMKDIVLVDNAAYSFGVNIENGIPIIPYYENKDDKELKHLYDFLVTHVLPAYDCRTVLQETFKLREFQKFSNPKTAIEKLYF